MKRMIKTIRKQWNTTKKSKQKEMRLIRFLLKFSVYAIPLYIVLILNLQSGAFQEFTAHVAAWILNTLGIPIVQTGTFIQIPIQDGSWGAFINWDCTGWKSITALFALIMATDAPRQKKLIGFLLLPIVYGVNISRIVFLFVFVQTAGLEYYDLVHTVIWSWGLISTVLVLWVIWMKYVAHPATQNLYR